MKPTSSTRLQRSLHRIFILLTVAAGVTSATGFPLKYGSVRSGQENPNIKPYSGRIAGYERPALLMGGAGSPCIVTSGVATWPGVPLLSTEEVRASCLADVNGDGNDDFIAVLHDTTQTASNWGSRIMATYFGGPSGFTLAYKMPFNSASYPYDAREQIVPADLDQDGDLDIVLLDGGELAYDQSVSWFTNFATNTGRFDTETAILSGNRSTMEFRDVVVMHANSDDYLDILVADRVQGKIRVFLNNTAGGFNEGTAITEDGPARLFAVDIDRDGKKDLLSASGIKGAGAPARLVWRRFQTLSFASPSILDTQSGDAWYGGATLGDITDDGVDDLVFVRTVLVTNPSGSITPNSTVWYRAGNPNVPGAFLATTQITEMPTSFHSIHSIAAGDIDRDGDTDIWCARGDNTAWTEIAILENLRPHGDSGAEVADFAGTHPTGAVSLASGDLNSDSWPDLVVAAAGTKAILWYAGGPGGTLAAPVTVSTGGLAPSSLSAGDIDGDRNVDLAWAVTSTGDIKRARNTNGTGTSWSTATVANLPGLNSVTMTNVNHDLDLDFLASSSSGTVQWYYNSNGVYAVDTVLNQPGVTRAVPLWLKTNYRQQVVAVSPFNGGNPGKVDIRDHSILSSPPWSVLHTETGGGTAAAAATAGDFDRDGYEDCVWAAGSSEVKWRNVNTTGAITNTIGTAPGIVRNLRRMDWNQDGWDDVLCAHSTGVLVWINSLGTSWKTLTLYTGGDCTDAIPFMLDGDRQPDVAAVDTTAGRLKLITHAPVLQQIEINDDKVQTFGAVFAEPSATPYVMLLQRKHLGLSESHGTSQGGWRSDSEAIGEHYRFRFLKADYQTSTGKWVPGRALTQAELAASVEKVMVIDDSWGGAASAAALDAADDVILGESGVSLTNGYQSVTITSNPATYEGSVLAPGSTYPSRLFVALKMKPAVSAATTGRFFIQHVLDPAQSGTRYATTEGWPARQLMGVTGTAGAGNEIRVATSYEIWRKSWYGTTSNSGPAADSADGDRDGMDNIAEYILGKNPTVADASPALLMEHYGSGHALYADLPLTAREDGIMTLQESATLTDWTTYAQVTGSASVWTGAPNVTIFYNGGRRTTFAPPDAGIKFYRLQFSLVP